MTGGNCSISLREGPLDANALAPPPAHDPAAGAVVTFQGIVRPTESGRPLRALHYQAYEPMTTRELNRLARDKITAHGLTSLVMQHSVGEVPIGRCSFLLCIAAPHRAEALAAMASFIDTMKRDVPLWKLPVWSDDT